MILQRLKINVNDPLVIAEKYFAIISTINDLDLAKREIQLIAFTAIKGNIGSETKKTEFVEHYKSSFATVGNIISKLSKMGILLKKKKLVSVNKALLQEFDKGIRMDLTLEYVSEQTT